MKHTIFTIAIVLCLCISACGSETCKQVCTTTGDKASGNYSEDCKQVCSGGSIGN